MERKLTDEELKELAQKGLDGDREAVRSLLSATTTDMYYVSRLFIGNKKEAREAEKKGLTAAFTKLNEGAEADSFTEWLSGFIKDAALETLLPVTVEESDAVYTEDDETADSEGLPEDPEERKLTVLHALDQLSGGERAAAVLKYYDHLSTEETAEKLQVSKEDAESLLTRAKETLSTAETGLGTLLAAAAKVNPKKYVSPIGNILSEVHSEEVTEKTIAVKLDEVEEAAKEPEFTSIEVPAEEQPELPEVPAETPAEEPAEEEENSSLDIFVPAAPAVVQEKPIEPERKEVITEKEEEPVKKRGSIIPAIIVFLLCACLIAATFWFLFIRKPGDPLLPWQKKETVTETAPAETAEAEETATAEVQATASPEATESPAAATPEVSEEPEASEEPAEETPVADTYGQLTVLVDELNIRTGPSTDYDAAGTAYANEVYDVYEIISDGTYTWYRIGEDQWIASDGSWVSY